MTVLLEFLMKALDSSDGNLVELSNTSGMEPISGKSKFLTGSTDIWMLIITKISSKEPELMIPVMLKALLDITESREFKKLDTVFSPGNGQLPEFALRLVQMVGNNNAVIVRFKKFSLIFHHSSLATTGLS